MTSKMNMESPREGGGPSWLPLLTRPLRRPALVLLIAAVLCAVSVWLASRSHASASLQDLIGRHNPAARALERVLGDFPSADELLLLVTLEGIRENPEDGVQELRAFAAGLDTTLKTDPATAPLCKSIAHAASPQMIDFFKNEAIPAGLMYLDDAEFSAFTARLSPQAMREQLHQDEALIAAPGPAAQALAKTLLKDPLRLREFLGSRLEQGRAGFRTWNNGPDFISPDGRSLLIRIAGTRPPSDLAFCKDFTAKVTRLADSIRPPTLKVQASGAYAIAAASESAIRRDLTGSVIGSIIVMQLVFLLGFRNLLAFLMAFAPVAIGLCVAFGVHALISPTLTPLTAVIGASLVGCAVDFSIYMLSYYENSRRSIADCGLRIADSKFGIKTATRNPQSAIEDALSSLAVPLTAAAATSIVGFAAIAFSSVHALKDFAVLGALGLTLALAGVLWVLPAMLRLSERAGRFASAGPRFHVGRLVQFVDDHSRASIGACLLIAAIAGVFAGQRPPRFETNLNVMHPSPNAPLATQQAIGEKFGAADTMLVYIEAKSPSDLVAASYKVEQALNSPAVTATGITGAMGLPTILPDPTAAPTRKQALAKLDAERILADFDAAVAESSFDPSAFTQFKDFLRSLLTSAPAPTLDTLAKYPDLRTMLTSSSGLEAITIVTAGSPHPHPVEDEHGITPQGAHDARVRDAQVETIRGALASIPGATLTGLTVIGYDVEHAVRHDLPIIIAAAAAAVFALLLLSLRSLKDAALACIPVVFGIAVLLGYMSIAGERLNLANTVAVPLLIGVGVDYGIFHVAMARQARHEGREGILRRFAASTHAILLTATTSIIGFGSLAFTSTPAVQSMGRVVAIGIAACVAGALLLLAPVLAHRAKEPRRGSGL
jgi:predicted RND superfamily exporter protein